MQASLIVVTVILAVGRFFITPRLDLPTATGSYEAVAHLFVGGLIGVWLASSNVKLGRLCLGLTIAFSLLEVIVFVVQKNAAG
jgi:hypothetical protein